MPPASPGSSLTRRQLLTGAAALAAGGALTTRFGHLVERAYAFEPTKCAPLTDVEHVVLLMMENRSFDHYFGTYRGVRGFADPRMLRHPDGRSILWQRGYRPGKGADPDGFLLPFHLDTRDLQKYAECTDDITHDWGPQHQAWDGGRMDEWVVEHLAADGDSIGPLAMGYYERSDLVFYHSLADAFTICDAYHCSVLGPTDPNRLYWFSATLDPDGDNGGPVLYTRVTNRAQGYGQLTWKTMPEVLQEAGISWKVYQDQSSDTLLNPLPYFHQYLTNPVLAPNATGAYTYPGTFQADVAAGTLPTVSWVFPSLPACEHPSAPPALGEQFVANVLTTLLANPAVWEKTALLVSYDENGGFFDHVPPPTPPPGTPGEYLTVHPLPAEADGVVGPVGLGFRVPMLVVSPYSRGGLVCRDVFDHTSQLRFLETRFGTPVPNLTSWRRSAVGDLTGAFNFAAAPVYRKPYLQQTTAADAEIVARECVPGGLTGFEDAGPVYPVPPNRLPEQAPGTAPAPSGLPASCR